MKIFKNMYFQSKMLFPFFTKENTFIEIETVKNEFVNVSKVT